MNKKNIQLIEKIANELYQNKIKYRFIDERWKIRGDVDMIISHDHIKKFEYILKKNNFKRKGFWPPQSRAYMGFHNNEILSKDIKFDVIFIDGLHLAEQVDLDIKNALGYIKDDGFIVLHDCNPPTEWHAREDYDYKNSPAQGYWNGTTWKAFLKSRFDSDLYSCCIDTDWGVGILSKKHPIGDSIKNTNPFYEYKVLDENRKSNLNLISFDELKKNLA